MIAHKRFSLHDSLSRLRSMATGWALIAWGPAGAVVRTRRRIHLWPEDYTYPCTWSSVAGKSDCLPLLDPGRFGHAPQRLHEVCQCAANRIHRDHIAMARDFKIDIHISISHLRRNSDGLAVTRFENTYAWHELLVGPRIAGGTFAEDRFKRVQGGRSAHLAIAANRSASAIYTLDTGLVSAGKMLGLPVRRGIAAAQGVHALSPAPVFDHFPPTNFSKTVTDSDQMLRCSGVIS